MRFEPPAIGLAIYRVDTPNSLIASRTWSNLNNVREQLLDEHFFSQHRQLACTNFLTIRDVSLRISLETAARYCIIPSTFEPGEEDEFFLRFFVEKF